MLYTIGKHVSDFGFQKIYVNSSKNVLFESYFTPK